MLAMDDEPRRREVAKALEYWALTAFVVGSMIYGIIVAIGDMIAGINWC